MSTYIQSIRGFAQFTTGAGMASAIKYGYEAVELLYFNGWGREVPPDRELNLGIRKIIYALGGAGIAIAGIAIDNLAYQLLNTQEDELNMVAQLRTLGGMNAIALLNYLNR